MTRWLGIALLTMGTATAWAADTDTDKTEGKAQMPRVKMTTTLGDIVIELNDEKAPISTENFLTYTDEKFYDGTVFHRVISTFMIQGGGFTSDLVQKKEGMHEPIKNEWQNGLKNTRGTIAMARTSNPDSATCQFFINVKDNANLDQPMSGGAGYAVFGKVVEGMDVVDKIRDVETQRHPRFGNREKAVPVETVVIQSVRRLDKDGKVIEPATNDQPKKEGD